MKKVIVFAVVAALAGGTVTILLHNKALSDARSKTEILKAIPVTTVPVEKKMLEEHLNLIGTVIARSDIQLMAETQGRIVNVKVKAGDVISVGTELASVDSELMEAQVIAAQAAYDKAKKDVDRFMDLKKSDAATDMQVEGVQLQLKAAEAQLITAKRQLRNTKILSPVNGTVVSENLEVGMMVAPGAPLANIVDITNVKLRVNVAEKDVFKLRKNERVLITTEVYPATQLSGVITMISEKGDDAHTYPVEIELANPKQTPLKTGMFARAHFTSIPQTETMVIPREALIGSIKDPKVYVVSGNKAVLRKIVLNGEQGDYLRVQEGLTPEESVVVTGQVNLRDGSEINVVK